MYSTPRWMPWLNAETIEWFILVLNLFHLIFSTFRIVAWRVIELKERVSPSVLS